jgi:methyl-accepting chemotaxis protein
MAILTKLDLRIGTKLALIQGMGILLVVGMIANAVYGSMSVNQASETATTQQLLALDLSEAKSDIRIMAIQVRDIRLAQENVDIQTAVKNLETRQASASKLILDNIPKVRVPENKERLQKAATLLNDYAVVAKQVAGIRSRVMGLDVGSVRLVTADEEAARLAREKITPLARQLNEAIDKAVENAQQTAKEETANAQAASASAQQIGWIIGGIVLIIMLSSAVFGSMSIARPLRRMASVLVELTHDRIVDVPFTQRKDEIGDIARATDIFKDSIAEKVANFRIKTGLDNIASNVMMTDESCNITYTNKAMAGMAQEAEADLRRDLPQFDAGKLLGSSLDIFYKNSSQHREMLAGLTTSHEEHIAISNRKYQVVTTPVIDKKAPGWAIWSTGRTKPRRRRSKLRCRTSCRRRSPAISTTGFRPMARRASCST